MKGLKNEFFFRVGMARLRDDGTNRREREEKCPRKVKKKGRRKSRKEEESRVGC